MKKVLVICSSFPPINATAIHRTVALVRCLALEGWPVQVLTMEPNSSVAVDDRLRTKIPSGMDVLRTRNIDLVYQLKRLVRLGRKKKAAVTRPPSADAPPGDGPGGGDSLRDWFTDWLQFPDSRIGWCLSGLFGGWKRVRAFAPDVIYSSAPMWSSHLLGLLYSRLLGVPWVADCRDPWRNNPYRVFAHRAHNRADALLECKTIQRAYRIICNTYNVQREFLDRYPQHATKFTTIPNGYDAAEIAAALHAATPRRDGLCRLVHAGNFYGPRTPEPYLAGLGEALRRRPTLAKKMRFVQVGSAQYESQPLARWARRWGADQLLELTGPVGHREALAVVAAGDVAIAASHDGPQSTLQIPRKFYEYYGMGKAILAAGGCCRAIADIFAPQAPPRGLWMVPHLEPGLLAEAFLDIAENWQHGRLQSPNTPTLDLTENCMARRIKQVLEQAMP